MVWNEGGFTPWSINTAFHSCVCVWSWSHVSVHLMFLCLYLCLDRDVLYVIEFMVHWWKPMHLQYHKICVCGVMCVCGQNPRWRTVSDAVFNNPVVICPSLRNRLCLQLQETVTMAEQRKEDYRWWNSQLFCVTHTTFFGSLGNEVQKHIQIFVRSKTIKQRALRSCWAWLIMTWMKPLIHYLVNISALVICDGGSLRALSRPMLGCQPMPGLSVSQCRGCQ